MSSGHSLFPDPFLNGAELLCSIIQHTYKIQPVTETLEQLHTCGSNTLNNDNTQESGSSTVLLGVQIDL